MTPSDLEIEMTRDFDAPRALVWEMFTKPEHVRQWWGYGMTEMIVCEIDFRVGGKYRYVGRTTSGNGEVVFEVLNTVTFAERDGKTMLSLHMRVVRANKLAPQYLRGAGEGWKQTLDKLGELLAR